MPRSFQRFIYVLLSIGPEAVRWGEDLAKRALAAATMAPRCVRNRFPRLSPSTDAEYVDRRCPLSRTIAPSSNERRSYRRMPACHPSNLTPSIIIRAALVFLSSIIALQWPPLGSLPRG